MKIEHVKLLQAASLLWDSCETGAPAIDPKRPYGNSNVAGDVAEILGIEWDGEDEEKEQELLDLHSETLDALHTILNSLPHEFGGTYKFTKLGLVKAE